MLTLNETIGLLDKLAEERDRQEALRISLAQAQEAAIPPEVRAKLDEIHKLYDPQLANNVVAIACLQQAIEKQMNAQDRLDAALLVADKAHYELWQALLRARLEACTVGDLPLVAKLQLWISDMIRMWQGCGPEETSGDSGLKHFANAVRIRRQQAERAAEDAGCPEVRIDEF